MKLKEPIFIANLLEMYTIPAFYRHWPERAERLRFQVFETKGFACVTCGDEADHVAVWFDHSGNIHTDACFFKDDKWTMLTLDHAIPKSRGGKKTLQNLQPMCEPCNHLKDDSI